MYSLYVLKSEKDDTRYVGVTAKDPFLRLTEHNNNKSMYTRGHQPWKIVHTESFDDKKNALDRERFLKSGQGRKWLDDNIG